MTHLPIKAWTEKILFSCGGNFASYFSIQILQKFAQSSRKRHKYEGVLEYIWIGGKSAITFEYRVRGAAFCNDQTRIGWAIGCITVATWTISRDDQDIFYGYFMFLDIMLTIFHQLFQSWNLNSILLIPKIRMIKVWSSFKMYKIGFCVTKSQMNWWYLLQSILQRTLFET